MKRNQQTSDSGCGRQTDLMTYLYDEASPAERGSFERHLEECQACSIELKAFERVRQDLDVWQLGLMPRMEISVNRSALDALREFVSLLPVWVRGTILATAAAGIILVALSVAGAWGRAQQSVDSGKVQLTRAEIETMIAERLAASRVDDERRQAEMRAQISNLSLQLAAASQSQTKLASSLVTLRAEHRALVAKGQSTLGEWLFASNGAENEKEK